MSGSLILVTMGIYFFVGAEQLAKGNVAGAITWLSYGVANTQDQRRRREDEP